MLIFIIGKFTNINKSAWRACSVGTLVPTFINVSKFTNDKNLAYK